MPGYVRQRSVLVERFVIAAIDQGTISSRWIVFDHGSRVVAADQREHRQISPTSTRWPAGR